MTGKRASPGKWKLVYTYENGTRSEFVLLCKLLQKNVLYYKPSSGAGAKYFVPYLSNTVGSSSRTERPNAATVQVLLQLYLVVITTTVVATVRNSNSETPV